MLTIINTANNRRSDYRRDYLAREARRIARAEPSSDGKVRAWRVEFFEKEGSVRLCVDFLTRDGQPKTASMVL